MRRYTKKIFIFLSIFVFIASFSVTAFAKESADFKAFKNMKNEKKEDTNKDNNNEVKKNKQNIEKDSKELINDAAGILSKTDKDELESEMKKVMDKYNIDFRLVIANEINEGKSFTDDDMSKYIQKYYKEHKIGKGKKNSGICFILAPDIRKFYGWYEGEAGDLISKSSANNLSDKFKSGLVGKKDLTNKDYTEALKIYTKRVEGEIRFRKFKVIGISVGIAALIALIATLIMRAQLNNARPKAFAGDYVKEGSFNITGRQDMFLHKTVSRRKIEHDSGSSGNHSSSSSSGHGSGGSF